VQSLQYQEPGVKIAKQYRKRIKKTVMLQHTIPEAFPVYYHDNPKFKTKKQLTYTTYVGQKLLYQGIHTVIIFFQIVAMTVHSLMNGYDEEGAASPDVNDLPLDAQPVVKTLMVGGDIYVLNVE
jgi:hypothetical protein